MELFAVEINTGDEFHLGNVANAAEASEYAELTDNIAMETSTFYTENWDFYIVTADGTKLWAYDGFRRLISPLYDFVPAQNRN